MNTAKSLPPFPTVDEIDCESITSWEDVPVVMDVPDGASFDLKDFHRRIQASIDRAAGKK